MQSIHAVLGSARTSRSALPCIPPGRSCSPAGRRADPALPSASALSCSISELLTVSRPTFTNPVTDIQRTQRPSTGNRGPSPAASATAGPDVDVDAAKPAFGALLIRRQVWSTSIASRFRLEADRAAARMALRCCLAGSHPDAQKDRRRALRRPPISASSGTDLGQA